MTFWRKVLHKKYSFDFRKMIAFELVSYNLGTFVAGKREKAQRRRPRFPLPRGPQPHSGQLFNGKKVPTAFSPSYAIQPKRNTLHLFKKRRIHFLFDSQCPTHNITFRDEAQ